MEGYLLYKLAFAVFCGMFQWGHVDSVKLEVDQAMVYYLEGRPLTLGCTAWDLPPGEVVEWLEAGMPVKAGKFKITTINESDKNGPYRRVTLTADNPDGSFVSSFHCVTRNNSKSVMTELLTVYSIGANISEGYDAVLECEFKPRMNDQTYNWTKGGLPLDEVAGLEGRWMLENDNATLIIKNAKLSDSGIYNCTMEFVDIAFAPTSNSQSFSVDVILQGKPYMVSDSTAELAVPTDTSLTLKCPAKGHPPPEVFWRRGEDYLESSSKFILSNVDGVTSAMIEIVTPEKPDFGEYVCVADNTMGKAEMKFNVVNSTEVVYKLASGGDKDVGTIAVKEVGLVQLALCVVVSMATIAAVA